MPDRSLCLSLEVIQMPLKFTEKGHLAMPVLWGNHCSMEDGLESERWETRKPIKRLL